MKTPYKIQPFFYFFTYKPFQIYYSRPPTQTPINPPYQEAVCIRKQDQLAKPEADQITKLESLELSDE